MKRFLAKLFRPKSLPAPDRSTIVPNQRPFEAGRYVTSGPLFGRRGKV